jgi:colicin import membrane protein
MAQEEAAMNDYYQSIWSIIRTKWAFPDDLLQGRNLMTIARVRIMRNGEIRDLSFEQKSSYSPFDESVMNAIKKASPLPPLPSEIRGASIELGIRFYSSQLAGR